MKAYIFTIIAAVVVIAISQNSFAATHTEEIELASHAAQTDTYKITDGYGTYIGHGATSLKAREMAWESCVADKVVRYESRFGQTPDADTADLFIDACINR